MQTQILPVNARSLALAKEILLAGGLVAFHTETVYGLGADARNDEAVRSVFAVKGRPADNPLIAHVHPDYDISRIVDGEPPYAAALRRAFLPGPLTMVYPSKGKVSRFVSCGLDTLSVRVPASPAAQAFLRALKTNKRQQILKLRPILQRRQRFADWVEQLFSFFAGFGLNGVHPQSISFLVPRFRR